MTATLPTFPTLTYDTWTDWIPTPDGGRARARIEPDPDARLTDDSERDWAGTFDSADRRPRPAGMNGAARKITTRHGPIWWQPPADVVRDPARLASLAERVRDYFLERWGYCTVVVEYETTPCACCRRVAREERTLSRVEDDTDYPAQCAADLLEELLTDQREATA